MLPPELAKLEIPRLRQRLRQAADAYYQTGQSPWSDEVYDQMLEELAKLEQAYPEFQVQDSPTLQVGAAAQFRPMAHPTRMYSLENCYTKEELFDWFAKTAKMLVEEYQILDPPSYVAELKIDGLAMSFLYAGGKLVHAVTRGDGVTGDEVTANVKALDALPLELAQPLDLELRGEIYLPRSAFETLREAQEAAGLPGFMNPRNAAAGSIRLKDAALVATRGLQVWVYDLVGAQALGRHEHTLRQLVDWGFPVNPHRLVSSDVEAIYSFCQNWETRRGELDFDIDGMVIKLDEVALRSRLGFTAKFPRWAKAWKFKAEKQRSRLLEVENSIGRTGALTPVALIEPVEIGGTWVKRASLHNYQQVQLLDLRWGDWVWIEKGGEIIPKITGVDLSMRSAAGEPLQPPENCPSCHTPLEQPEGMVDLRCPNPQCPAQLQGRLEHFASKKALDIRGLGPSQIELFIREGLLKDLPDIFRLAQHQATLLSWEGYQEKSVNNLLQAIEAAKTRRLDHCLFGLGIRHIGEKAAKLLAQVAGDLPGFLRLTPEQLERLPDMGGIMRQSLFQWLGQGENQAMVQDLISLGLTPPPLVQAAQGRFGGKSVVITGTLSQPRGEWKFKLEQQGFKVLGAVSKKTDYLLAGQEAGSKLKEALKLGIPVLDEAAMRTLLGEAD